MAVLGKIRQRSIFLILVIGMALFAFVISGVFDGSSSNTGPTDPIAVVNDEEIDVMFFRQMVEQTERTYNYSTLQSVNLVWNQALRNTIFDQEFKKLGIDAGKDQLEQIISSDEAVINNPNFQNEAGFFDFGIFTDYKIRDQWLWLIILVVLLLISILGSLDASLLGGYELGYELLPLNGLLTFLGLILIRRK